MAEWLWLEMTWQIAFIDSIYMQMFCFKRRNELRQIWIGFTGFVLYLKGFAKGQKGKCMHKLRTWFFNVETAANAGLLGQFQVDDSNRTP